MKITRAQLKQIIKEEIQKVSEQMAGNPLAQSGYAPPEEIPSEFGGEFSDFEQMFHSLELAPHFKKLGLDPGAVLSAGSSDPEIVSVANDFLSSFRGMTLAHGRAGLLTPRDVLADQIGRSLGML